MKYQRFLLIYIKIVLIPELCLSNGNMPTYALFTRKERNRILQITSRYLSILYTAMLWSIFHDMECSLIVNMALERGGGNKWLVHYSNILANIHWIGNNFIHSFGKFVFLVFSMWTFEFQIIKSVIFWRSWEKLHDCKTTSENAGKICVVELFTVDHLILHILNIPIDYHFFFLSALNYPFG